MTREEIIRALNKLIKDISTERLRRLLATAVVLVRKDD